MNEFLWPLANVLVVYVTLALLTFCIGYPILFNPRASTTGRGILRFAISLLGVMVLVFVSLFVDPRDDVPWWVLPVGVDVWRPVVRVVVYGFASYAVTALGVTLHLRRFRPRPPVDEQPSENTAPVVRIPRRR